MRAPYFIVVLSGFGFLAVSQAGAASLYIPDAKSAAYSAYSARAIEQPWATQRPEVQLREQPIADILATRLGIARGSAELFRYRLENAPSNATVLRGQVDGGGIKLKLTW